MNASEATPGHGVTDNGRGPAAFVRRHGLISFYALAYGLSWLAWIPWILSQYGLGVLDIPVPGLLGLPGELIGQLVLLLPGAFLGPLGGAFIVTAISEGRAGLRRWRGRLFRLGVGLKWYALALVGVPAIIIAGTLVLPGMVGDFQLPPVEYLLLYAPLLVLQIFTTGLAEEPGWRDYALVRHQRLHGPLVGTLILSVLWAGWHFPLFLTAWGAGIGGANPRTMLLFVAFCIALSVVITWVFNRTRESLPLAILIHASNNTFASLLLIAMFTTLDPSRDVLTGGLIAYTALALVLVVATRGKLGYSGGSDNDRSSGGEAGGELGGVPAGGTGVAGRGSDLPVARET